MLTAKIKKSRRHRRGLSVRLKVNRQVLIQKNRRKEKMYLKIFQMERFVETLDDEKKRIRIGRKFIPNGQFLEKKDISEIKRDCFTTRNVRFKNKKKVRKLKGRK